MEKVYIISRYRAKTSRQQEFNLGVARYFARQVVKEDKLPIVPHIYFTQFMDDSDEDERKCGLSLGIHALKQCDEFLLVVIDGNISEGMQKEIEVVLRLGIPGRIVCLTRRDVIECIKNTV